MQVVFFSLFINDPEVNEHRDVKLTCSFGSFIQAENKAAHRSTVNTFVCLREERIDTSLYKLISWGGKKIATRVQHNRLLVWYFHFITSDGQKASQKKYL